MDIILLQDVEKVGYKHEIVQVKDGFGRNYLIPQGLALIANKSNLGRLAELKRREEAREAARLGDYQEVADKLKDIVLKIGAKAGTSGKIFGSVTNVQLAAVLKEEHNIDIERRKIELNEEVKTIGTYTATADLHPEVQAEIKFEVVEE